MANPPQIQEMVRLLGEERYAEALAKVDELLVGQPGLAMAWRFKSECLMKLQRYEEAIPCLEKCEALGGRAGEDAAIKRATAEWNAGRPAEARATLEAVVDNEGAKYSEDTVEIAKALRSAMEAKAPGEK
jgi:tetratricopeptide (TPR) repeat protein